MQVIKWKVLNYRWTIDGQSSSLDKVPISDNSITARHTYDNVCNVELNSYSGKDSSSENGQDFQNILMIPPIEGAHTFSNQTEKSLSFKLRQWALQHNIPQVAVTKLLHILKPSHPELPLDARTLLNTLRVIVLKEVSPGKNCHFGLKKCIEKFIVSSQLSNKTSDIIELGINIDGLPLSKSSGSQLYPILCNILGTNLIDIKGIYHGNL